MLYGFREQEARILKRLARTTGLHSSPGTKVRYPKPLPEDAPPIRLGKPTANVTAPNTVTVNIYEGTQGSEASTGEQVSAYTYVDLDSTKFCTVAVINGKNYAGCYQQ